MATMDDLIQIKFSLEGAPQNAVRNIIHKNLSEGIKYYFINSNSHNHQLPVYGYDDEPMPTERDIYRKVKRVLKPKPLTNLSQTLEINAKNKK